MTHAVTQAADAVNGLDQWFGPSGSRSEAPGRPKTPKRSIDPGDVGKGARQALDLARHARLPGLQIDRVQRPAGYKPRAVVLIAVHDIEGHRSIERNPKRPDGVEDAVVRGRLGHE